MLTAEFIKTGEPTFLNPAILHLNFLVEEYHFEASGFAEAYETVITYEKGDIRINVVFAIPEAPFVVMQKIVGNKIVKEIRYKPMTKEIKLLLKEYNNFRDTFPLEKWHKKLRKGEFNQLLDGILTCLAKELRSTHPWEKLEKIS